MLFNVIIVLFFSLAHIEVNPNPLKVYLVDGNIEYYAPGGEKKKLNKGDEIMNGEVVILDGKIIFFNENGDNIILKDPGKYSYQRITDEMAKKEDISSEFFKYTWKMMNKKKEKPEDMNMLAGGVVERGKKFQILLPADSAIIFNPKLNVEWNEANGPYQVQVYDFQENLIQSFDTDDQKAELSLNKENYPENIILLTIRDRSNTYTDYVTLYLFDL